MYVLHRLALILRICAGIPRDARRLGYYLARISGGAYRLARAILNQAVSVVAIILFVGASPSAFAQGGCVSYYAEYDWHRTYTLPARGDYVMTIHITNAAGGSRFFNVVRSAGTLYEIVYTVDNATLDARGQVTVTLYDVTHIHWHRVSANVNICPLVVATPTPEPTPEPTPSSGNMFCLPPPAPTSTPSVTPTQCVGAACAALGVGGLATPTPSATPTPRPTVCVPLFDVTPLAVLPLDVDDKQLQPDVRPIAFTGGFVYRECYDLWPGFELDFSSIPLLSGLGVWSSPPFGACVSYYDFSISYDGNDLKNYLYPAVAFATALILFFYYRRG